MSVQNVNSSNALNLAVANYPEEAPNSWEVAEEIISSDQAISQTVECFKRSFYTIDISKTMEELSQVKTFLPLALVATKGFSCHTSVIDTWKCYESLIKDSLANSNELVNYSLESLKHHSFTLLFVKNEQYTEALEVIAKVGEEAKRMKELSKQLFRNADLLCEQSQKAWRSIFSSQVEKNELETELQFLDIAFSVLRKIKTASEDAKLFLGGVKEHCKRLSNVKQIKKVALLASQGKLSKEMLSNEIKKSGLSFLSIGRIAYLAKKNLIDINEHIDGMMTNLPSLEEVPSSWEVAEEIVSSDQVISETVEMNKRKFYTIDISKTMEELSEVKTFLQLALVATKGFSCHTSVIDTWKCYESLIKDSLANSNELVNYSLRSLKHHSFALLFVKNEQYTEALEVIAKVGEEAKRMKELPEQLVRNADLLCQQSQKAWESICKDQSARLAEKHKRIFSSQVEENELETALQSLDIASTTLGNIKTAFENAKSFWRGVEKHCKHLSNVKQIERVGLMASQGKLSKEMLSNEIKKSGLNFLSIGRIAYLAKKNLININEYIDGMMTNLPSGEGSRRLVNDTLEKIKQKLKEEYQE